MILLNFGNFDQDSYKTIAVDFKCLCLGLQGANSYKEKDWDILALEVAPDHVHLFLGESAMGSISRC
ncbi:hypothetical protein [Cylindrospermopsis curvispora]|uniref:Transposase IS200-like domain-containing protein n=1 Tax=Cylindrospermopsis curvispora GIHE-G1 TaxID=2666332 RepID=A0A7H0F0F5_9CYAN|nr:hypothetical protein [Cylindrospermopsis curvispora]QNP29521.1 hypothetical protein IAR63_17185 [Cylindrospermopsis curvispora GIHE-G1]